MGLQVDVSSLSHDECSKIIGVIAKDVSLRRAEQERIRKVRKEFDELRKEITLKSSKRRSLDGNCLICGRMLLKFFCFFNRAQQCIACEHMVCANCRRMLLLHNNNDNKNFLCLLCVKKRDVKRKSFDWFYEAVEQKFKRFGSAKVLRGIYKCRKDSPQVITLIGLTREMTYAGASFSLSRRSSVLEPSLLPSLRIHSPSSLSEPDIKEATKTPRRRPTARSKSVDDLSQKSEMKPEFRSKKISAPNLHLGLHVVQKNEEEVSMKPMQTTVEEEESSFSGQSEFQVFPVDQLELDRSSNKTSFTVKLFGNVEFIVMASVGLILALFLSFLACVGYIDVFLIDSEEEDEPKER